MAIEERVGIKEEGLLGCKEREKGIASKEEALVINVRGTMATTTLWILSLYRSCAWCPFHAYGPYVE